MVNFGYDTHYPLLNMKTLSILQCLFLVRVGICFALKLFKSFPNETIKIYTQRVQENLETKLMYGEILAILL